VNYSVAFSRRLFILGDKLSSKPSMPREIVFNRTIVNIIWLKNEELMKKKILFRTPNAYEMVKDEKCNLYNAPIARDPDLFILIVERVEYLIKRKVISGFLNRVAWVGVVVNCAAFHVINLKQDYLKKSNTLPLFTCTHQQNNSHWTSYLENVPTHAHTYGQTNWKSICIRFLK